MISVEKRRSSRKSGKHRKRSDTSSGGSFLDENDREVSSLTDRAFKSLCIGDEAVYNDSHLGLPSSSTHIDRQLAFTQGEPFRDEDERDELKRAAHQNFSLRVQHYGQDWVHGGMYGTATQQDPEWGVYGDRTQGRVSATFQNSFVETSQQGMSLREEELSFISNGATELSLHQHRSRSRVSSLIRTFNSEVKRNGASMDDQFRGCTEETRWDKSALMNMHNEFSDFSSSYQQNLNINSNFPSAGPFSCRDANFYGSDMAAVAHMSHNSVSSFMRSSHNELSMSAQTNCNSHFFIHSEFSPFKVWREHNRFPFQQREVSGFMHSSEFPKWYETPMYKELSLENQLQGPYRGMRHSNNLAPRAPSNPSHFTSMSLVQQKASAVEKRSESELAGHYPQRRRAQSLGTNKLPSQRPSTASPTIEMSRRVRDTISSVKALQQKIKLMSEQNISAGMITTQQETFGNHNLVHSGNSVAPNMVRSDISTTPFTISQLPSVSAHQDENTSGFQQHEPSPQPVEHPPVRAESRGVTPDGRLSSYKSRATSLLFNLKDNRKRVKSTYSPTKFKGLDKQEKNQQPSSLETVIDVPDFLDPDIPFMQQENSRSTTMAANQYQNPPLTLETQLERVNTGQYLENTSTDYQTAQVQGEMVCHSGFSGFIPGNYTSNQLTNGQNRHEYLASFTPYKQGGRDNIQLQEGLQHPHTAVDATRPNIYRSQSKDSLIRKAEPEQALNEPTGKIITERGRYENLQDQINEYHNTSSNGNWQNCKDTEKVSLKAAASPLKQDPVHPMERLRQENQRNLHKEAENDEAMDSLSLGPSSYKSAISNNNNFSNQPNAEKRENVQDMRDDVVLNYNRDQDPMRSNQLYPIIDKTKQNAAPIKTYTSRVTEDEKQRLQDESKPKLINVGQKKPSLYTDNASEFMMLNHKQLDEAKIEQVMAENNRVKAEMAAAQQRANAEQPKAETSRLILAGQADSETDSKAEAAKAEALKQEFVKKEEGKGELKEQARDKHPDGEQTAGKTRARMSTDTSTGVLGEDEVREQVKHLKEVQGETQKAEDKQKQTQMANVEKERIQEGRTAKETEKTNNSVQAESKIIETERVRSEKIQLEEAETKWKTTEKTEQTNDQNNKTKQTKIEDADNGRVMHVVQAKKEKDSIVSRQVNAEKSTAWDFKDSKPEERKTEQLKQEERKVELSKAELLKTENLLEKSAKLTAKLVATQQVRNESDKVEHVKTELAKAKAELAKIKEKMRGEQKEKVSNSVIVREDETLKNNSSSSVDGAKKVDQKTQDQAVEPKADQVPDEYQRLREKYGFVHAVSTHKNNTSASESALTPASEEKMEKVEAGNNEESKNVPSPASTFKISDTQNTKEEINFRNSESTEGQVDNKSSMETCNVKSSNTNEYERTNEEDVANKLKNPNVEKTQNIDSKMDNISSQSNSELAKLQPLDGKPNLTEHSKSSGKEPPKMLSHKEKAQTKQEILTSKIKAHAEKEISALKEKGFSLGKNSSKQFVGSQNFNARQKPLSQDAPKRLEGVVSNSVSPKHPLESSGVKAELEFARTTTQNEDCLEKPRKTNHTANNIDATESSKKKQAEVKPSIQNTEQTAKNDQQKQQEIQREVSKKQIDKVEDQSTSKEIINNSIEGQAATASKSLTTKNTAREGNTHKDSQPPNTTLGQTDFYETNESLNIMGIMVTVREGKPPQTSYKTLTESTKKEVNELELDKRRFSPGTDGNTDSKEMNSVKAVDGQKSHSPVNEGVAKAVENIDAPKAALSLEAKDINLRRAAIEKTMNLQQGNPTPELLSKPDFMKGTQLIKTDAQKSKQQTALSNTDRISNMVSSGTNCHTDVETSSKKLAEEVDKIQCLNIDVHSAPPSEESTHDSAKPFSNAPPSSHSTEPENKPPDVQNKDKDITDKSHGDDNLHIDCIAIRVVPAVTENDKRDIVEKPLNTTFPSSANFAPDKQQTAASSYETNGKQCSEGASSAISEHGMNESLENNLAVQHVLSSVRKLSDLMKMNNKASNLNVVSETAEAKAETLESNVEPNEVDYFQVQGQEEANTEAQNNCTTVEATPKKRELQDTPPNKTVNIEDSPKDGQPEVFVFHVDQCLKKDLISEKPQDDSIKKLETVGTPASKMSSSSFDPCNNEGKVDAGQANHTGKNQSENQLGLSATDKESSRPFPQTKAEKVTAKPEVKPKLKDKISAIPEISAIADYARLKVIVSEDKEQNTAQDFPPSKKEGFFPLIRGHHSRRPVFTTDLHEHSVKENKLSTKTDVSAKPSKEPKATIFPITEREHQRTGMFKLGDKDKQEKILLETVSAQTKQVNEVEMQEIPSKTGEPITQPPKSSSSSVSSGLTSRDPTYFDKSLPFQGALGERRLKEDTTYLRKHESPEEQLNVNHNNEGGRSDQLRKERLANQIEDNKMKKLDKGKQLDEELMPRNENRKSNVRIKHIIEESRASLAEEERRAAQREEEKRAKEREAVAQMIKERREQQRQAEEERKTTNTKDTITGQNAKDFQTKQTQEQTRITETECSFGYDEQLKRTAMEQHRTTQDKQQRRGAMEQQWRSAQEEQQQRAAKEQRVKTPLEQQIKRESDVQVMKIIQEKQQQVEQQNKMLQKEHQGRAAGDQMTRSAQDEKQIETVEQQQLRFSKEEENKRAVQIEHQKVHVQEEQKQKATEEQQKKHAEEEKQRRVLEEIQRKTISEELLKRSTEKQQWRTSQEEQQKGTVKEEGMRLHQEGQQKRTTEEKQRQPVQKEQYKGEVDVQQRRLVLEQQRKTIEEKQNKLFQEEHQRKAAEEQQRGYFKDEHQRRDPERQQQKLFQEEKQRKTVEEQQRNFFKKEQQRKLFQEEQQRKAAEEQQRKLLQEEQQRKAAEEQQRRAVEEQQRKLLQEEQQRKAVEEQQRKLLQEEQQRKAAEEQQRRAVEEQQRKLLQEEQQRRAAEEQRRRHVQEEQQRKATEEQQRKLFQEEQQKKAADEQYRRHVQEEQQRKAAEEQQKRHVHEELQKRAKEEQQRKLFQEEQQRKAVEEQQQRHVQEEQQRRVAEEQQRRHVQEQRRRSAGEQQRKLFQEEQQRKAIEEQQMRHIQEEQQRRGAEEQQQRHIQEGQQKRAKEEQQRRLVPEEQRRRAENEQQKRLFQGKQYTKAAEEHQKTPTDRRQEKYVQEEQARRAAEQQETAIPPEEERQIIIEKQQRTAQEKQQKMSANGEQHRRVAEQIDERTLPEKVYRKEQRTDENAVNSFNMGIQQMPEQEKEEQQIEKLRRRRSLNHPLLKALQDEGVMVVDEKEITLKPEEKLATKDHSAKPLEEKRMAEELFGEKSKQKEENSIIHREKTGVTQAENQKQKMNDLQYYAFTSADTEGKSREKQFSSLLHSEQKSSPVRLNSPDDSVFQTKSPRPLAPASPASSLPRSNTSSPALGAKPSMFKVKDNTIRSSSFIKSVKPRFHKNFGEDFLVASPLDRLFEKGDDEREKIRSGAGTPVHAEIGMKRLTANTEFSTLLSSSSIQDYSVSHHRPYSRRSIVLDDDESRSVVSNLSEDVESYATSAADVGDVKGLFDFERPESACSFSSDVSRSLGKPPVVPPKTEKALRRAQRLTSRRMKKEQSKVAAGGEKETSSVPSSSSTETYQSNNHVVASPHFSQPVSLAHAPVLGSSLPSSSSELQSVPRSFHSSPHATAPVSLPVLPNATSTVSLPTVSPHASGTVSQPTAPKPVPNAPSSSTLHHANHPTPVAQYHVESCCFSQSYPMTQRKVLQDLGSGQYYVVDVPVQVQTKTFFDPETGKYVQLNVRESGQSVSRPHTQQTQPHQIKLQPQPLSQTPAAGKPFVLYQRYHSYPQNYQPTAVTPVRRSRSSAPGSLQPNNESLSENCSYGNIANEVEHNSVEPCYSPEKTPYMDTVIDTERTHNSVKNTQNPTESASESGTKSQTDGNSFHENHEMGRDIISMGELEDFMESSDW
ncbi:uncharacterized protein LOC112162014 [Oryzias melastigma]|uniref:uncharacterized protein LOC112162014 n=1 Tax=Oryzias melastigma TaxID=30732 RepID=UPI000CF80452|nr:uncharacterized protein LOC112162014 [Oryzias melastigma]